MYSDTLSIVSPSSWWIRQFSLHYTYWSLKAVTLLVYSVSISHPVVSLYFSLLHVSLGLLLFLLPGGVSFDAPLGMEVGRPFYTYSICVHAMPFSFFIYSVRGVMIIYLLGLHTVLYFCQKMRTVFCKDLGSERHLSWMFLMASIPFQDSALYMRTWGTLL